MMSHSTSEKQRRRQLKRRLKTTRNKTLVELGELGSGDRDQGNEESWGDSMGTKNKETIRIGLQMSDHNRPTRTTLMQC